MVRTRAEVWFVAMIFCFGVGSLGCLGLLWKGAPMEQVLFTLLIAGWAPVFGVLGIRAHLLRSMGVSSREPAPDDARVRPRTDA